MKKNLIIAAVFAVIFAVTAACDPHTHTWGAWEVTKAPTATAEGIETKTCTDCGKTDTRPIAKLIAGVDVPKEQGGPQEGFTLFDGGDEYDLSITGTFLDSEWEWLNDEGEKESIEDTVKSRIIAHYNEMADASMSFVVTGPLGLGIDIIVEDPASDLEGYYANYKTTGDKKTVYLNINAITDTMNIAKVFESLNSGIPTVSKAAPVPQYNRARNVIVTPWCLSRLGVRNRICLVPLGVMVHHI